MYFIIWKLKILFIKFEIHWNKIKDANNKLNNNNCEKHRDNKVKPLYIKKNFFNEFRDKGRRVCDKYIYIYIYIYIKQVRFQDL